MTADEYIAQRRQVETTRALVATHYRWWTLSVSGDHVKLGPISVCWYRWAIEVIALCRYPLVRLGGVWDL